MMQYRLDMKQVLEAIDRALAEDSGWGDATTDALIPPGVVGSAVLLAKEDGVIAGLEVARAVFLRVDPSLEVELLGADGDRVPSGERLGVVKGSAASILTGERVALNFLQRMSGIATQTSKYVEAVKGTPAVVVDTRKTVPGLRYLDKYAVRMGGGHNHRLNLSDGILIKDNHLAVLRGRGMSLKQLLRSAREKARFTLRIEVEVTSHEDALEAVEAGADIVMLDNMSPSEMRRVVEALRGRVLLEASGGINLDTIRDVASTGVDLISVGAVTHSVKALDISLEMD